MCLLSDHDKDLSRRVRWDVDETKSGSFVFSYSSNSSVQFTTESHDAGELGVFVLSTADGKSAAGGVFNPGLAKFETNDSSAQFFYSSWSEVMKANTVEVNINKNKKRLTITFCAGEKIVGAFSSLVPDNVKDFSRVTCFNWKVRSRLCLVIRVLIALK